MSSDSEHDEGNGRDLRYDIYQHSRSPLSQEEAQSLNPILNSLKNPESRYEAPELIAEGGEKQVYKVYDRHLNRFVAMARAGKAETEREQEQFLREGQLTANLTHPNIVPIHNMGIDKDGNPFFSMELVPGDSLRDIIDKLKADDAVYKTRYPLEILLNIFNKVCDAVAYAHSRNVLHLDIKPANIRVGQFGEVFMCDWGLSSVDNPSSEEGESKPGQLDSDVLNDMTLTGTMKGSPGFMAPEQVTNRDKTRQTDIYALGALLYLILTHQLPVDGKSVNEILKNTRNGNITPPRKRKTGLPVPSGLAAVAMKALALEPQDRYASVQRLQSDINRFLTGYPTEAEHANIFTRATLLTLRHRKMAFWMIVFFALLTIVMSINLTIIQREKEHADTNFSLYRQQHEEALRLNEELVKIFSHTRNVRSFVSAREMIEIQKQILTRSQIDPNTRQDILYQKAKMHLVLQQFTAAVESFEQLQNPTERQLKQLELCREYARIKPHNWGALSDHDLARLLTSDRKILARDLALFVYYHDRNQRDRIQKDPTKRIQIVPEEHIEVVGAILARMNSIDAHLIPEFKLTEDSRGTHLDMSHTPYSSYLLDFPLTVSKNVFQPLHLYSLDISHTPVTQTKELYGLKVEELRMVGVSFKPAKTIDSMIVSTGAKRVVLSKGAYPDWIIQWLRDKGVEVVEEEVGNVE